MLDVQEEEDRSKLIKTGKYDLIANDSRQCDVKGPPCGPCVRSNRACGFPQKHIFVLNDENSHKTIYRKKTTREQIESSYERTDPSIDTNSDHHGGIKRVSDIRSTEVVHRQFGTLTAIKQQLLEHACVGKLRVTHETYRGRPWTMAIAAFADSPYALNSAPLACYTSFLGRCNSDLHLVEVSQRLYVQGLR